MTGRNPLSFFVMLVLEKGAGAGGEGSLSQQGDAQSSIRYSAMRAAVSRSASMCVRS